MHKIELDIKTSYNWNMTTFFKTYNKQELKHDTIKIDALFGVTALLCLYNSDILEDYSISMANVIDAACIQDNELYLNNFEGYQLSDRLILKTIYINENDNIVFSVYDNKKDRYIDFIQ